jgi:hypothetical protein
MAGLSNTDELSVLQWLFKRTTMPAVPTVLAYGLNGTDPGDTGANELAATGAYARAQLNPDTNNSTNVNYNAAVTVGTAQRITNLLDIVFPTATADWFSAAAIPFWTGWDATTAGACRFSGTITGGVVVRNTNTLRFAGGATGAMSVDID